MNKISYKLKGIPKINLKTALELGLEQLNFTYSSDGGVCSISFGNSFAETLSLETLRAGFAYNQSQQKEYVGYWFFQQRTDKRSIHIQFKETKIEYCANRLLVLDSEQTFSVINKGAKLPNTLNCIVYFNSIEQNKIKEFLSL